MGLGCGSSASTGGTISGVFCTIWGVSMLLESSGGVILSASSFAGSAEFTETIDGGETTVSCAGTI